MTTFDTSEAGASPASEASERELSSIFFDMFAPADPAFAVGNPSPDGPRPVGVEAYFAGRIQSNDLVSHKTSDGIRLTIFNIAPGTVLPRHRHDVDYIEFVLEGEVHMGSRVVRKGGGVFRKAGTVYTYYAGPEGAVVADFRAHTFYRTEWVDDPANFPPHKEF